MASSERCLVVGVLLALVVGAAAPSGAQTLRSPRRIDEGPRGQLLVTDRQGSIVGVSKASLETLWSVQLPDEGAPFGLASWNRLLFVGNTETHNVEAYHLVGSHRREMRLRFAYNLGHTPRGSLGTMRRPIGIAFDREMRLVFVLDAKTKKVKIFDARGNPHHEFAPRGEAGRVLSPVSIAVDEGRQEVLIGDFGDPSGSFRARRPARILIFDYDGELQFQINGNGSTHITTRFARIQGMAVSSDGRIFAADPLGGRILVFDRLDGSLLDELGSQGPQPGELMLPSDVYLDGATGDLFVTNDRGARRVEAVRGAGR